MNRPDAEATLALVKDLWPRLEWPPDIRSEFARRIARLPIDLEQARAALLEVRMTKPFTSCQPSDLLGPLEAAAAGASRATVGEHREDDRALVTAYMNAYPREFARLCGEAHAATPGTPGHYPLALCCYIDWPRTRTWLANRIRAIQGGSL